MLTFHTLLLLIIHFTLTCGCSGNIDVEVLVETENVLAAYALPKAALSFSAALSSSRPRTKYASNVFVCFPERIKSICMFFVMNNSHQLPPISFNLL
jgi:hypothetical protein